MRHSLLAGYPLWWDRQFLPKRR